MMPMGEDVESRYRATMGKDLTPLTPLQQETLSRFFDDLVGWQPIPTWRDRLRWAGHYLHMVFYRPLRKGSEGIWWLEEVWAALRGKRPAWDDWQEDSKK